VTPDAAARSDVGGARKKPLMDSGRRNGSAPSTQERDVRDLVTELRRRFSFTRSEANIALLLAEGLSYTEVAERLGVSYHTVHTHVKAVHAKARVSSNGRLLALIHTMEAG
jgi:DNA-binding CsgD family transcriptional regulator